MINTNHDDFDESRQRKAIKLKPLNQKLFGGWWICLILIVLFIWQRSTNPITSRTNSWIEMDSRNLWSMKYVSIPPVGSLVFVITSTVSGRVATMSSIPRVNCTRTRSGNVRVGQIQSETRESVTEFSFAQRKHERRDSELAYRKFKLAQSVMRGTIGADFSVLSDSFISAKFDDENSHSSANDPGGEAESEDTVKKFIQPCKCEVTPEDHFHCRSESCVNALLGYAQFNKSKRKNELIKQNQATIYKLT